MHAASIDRFIGCHGLTDRAEEEEDVREGESNGRAAINSVHAYVLLADRDAAVQCSAVRARWVRETGGRNPIDFSSFGALYGTYVIEATCVR